MMNWAAYLKEREGYDTYETDKLFLLYREETPGIFYIRDIYVMPEHRGNHVVLASQDDFEIYMRERGAKVLRGTVSFRVPGTTRSIRMMLGLGYSPIGVNSMGQLVFEKELD